MSGWVLFWSNDAWNIGLISLVNRAEEIVLELFFLQLCHSCVLQRFFRPQFERLPKCLIFSLTSQCSLKNHHEMESTKYQYNVYRFCINNFSRWILIESVEPVSSSYVAFFFFFFFKCRGLWKELSKLFPTAISANLFCWKVSNRCRKWNDDVNPLDHEQFWCQHVEPFFPTKHSHPVGIYLLKVNYRNTIVSFWCLYCQLWTYFTPCFSVSFVNFKHVIAGWASTYCHIDCVYNILFWFTFY